MTAARRQDVDTLVLGETERSAPRFPSEPTALGDDEELFCRCTEVIWDGIQSATAPPSIPACVPSRAPHRPPPTTEDNAA